MTVIIENIVVDTTAFLNNVQLQELATNTITVPDVVEEVRCKRQLRRLVVLPYDLKVKEVDDDCISFVTRFAKKTGDYMYLSATDIKLIALTYQLEKEHLGVEHLRTEPIIDKVIEPLNSNLSNNQPKGFYIPDKTDLVENCDDDSVVPNINKDNGNDLQEVPDVIFKGTEEVLKQFSKLSCQELETNNVDHEQSDEFDNESENDLDEYESDEGLDPCITDGDDAGWITPSNFKRQNYKNDDNCDEKRIIIACLTTDFAMQNVLKQIGLNVISFDGRLIKEIRTYVFRCYGCFHITPKTTRTFCPKCGNKTLKKVSLRVDANGKQHIEINFKHQITARGKKFPLPRFKGGKHAVNPILCEDQRVPQQRLSKLALTKNNPMNPDYIAGVSPFVMRDVCSRSAIIQAGHKNDIKYWMRKNPNEVIKKRRKK